MGRVHSKVQVRSKLRFYVLLGFSFFTIVSKSDFILIYFAHFRSIRGSLTFDFKKAREMSENFPGKRRWTFLRLLFETILLLLFSILPELLFAFCTTQLFLLFFLPVCWPQKVSYLPNDCNFFIYVCVARICGLALFRKFVTHYGTFWLLFGLPTPFFGPRRCYDAAAC